MALQLLLLLLFCVILVKTLEIEDLQCPEGCECRMVQNLRGTFCIGEKLTTIEANVPDQVQFLDFSDNMISKLDDYAFKELNLKNLVVLNISTNSLSQISLRSFDGLEQLQILDLSYNIIHSLPEDVFENNVGLLKLYLSGNKIGFLEPKPLLNSMSLQVLELSGCVISHLFSQTFSKLPSLTTIDISQNFIIQLQTKIFDNLSELKSLEFSGNQLDCNNDLTDLILYLKKRQIKFNNVCEQEKFQKLVIQVPTTEKSSLLNWNFDNCDIETIEQVSNGTKCDVTNENNYLSTFFMVISFVCGLMSGISASCCYVTFNYLIKKRKKNVSTTVRRRMVRRSFHQPRDDFLLSETSYNLGLSTPVLSRTRHSSIR